MKASKQKLILHRHDALCHFYRVEDNGEWFAVCCAKDAMKLIGRTIDNGERVSIEIEVREI
jgi:hypothetical protein